MATAHHDFVFVVTYGRSGSTLLQGLLNTLPETLIRGENRLYPLQLFRAHDQLGRHRQTFNRPATRRPSSAFYGLDECDLDAFARDAGDLVARQLLGEADRGDVKRLGFKEVGWHRVRPQETEGFFAFLDVAFDMPRFILNQRAVEETRRSGFWREKEPELVTEKVGRVQEIQEWLRRTRPDRVLDVRYESFTAKKKAVVETELERLARFVVGEVDPAVMEALRTTLAIPHGPSPFGGSPATAPTRT